MDVIGSTPLWSFFDSKPACQKASCADVRNGSGHKVASFPELAKKIAELQFRNRSFVLLFRGQTGDYRNRDGNTSLKPTLFRADAGAHRNPKVATLESRFKNLNKAEELLVRRYGGVTTLGLTRLKRQRILRWAILQHYEVCPTPLLDVTHSLRIAASFASSAHSMAGFVFVLGIPNISGAVTASSEAGLQVLRLSSVCPPSAIRPHIQEGYLLGEYPEFSELAQKEHYKHYELDFGRRLIAKFCFEPRTFWKAGLFPVVPKSALYPGSSLDPMESLAAGIKSSVGVAE